MLPRNFYINNIMSIHIQTEYGLYKEVCSFTGTLCMSSPAVSACILKPYFHVDVCNHPTGYTGHIQLTGLQLSLGMKER